MAYVFQAVPSDLFHAVPPQLSPTEPETRTCERLAGVFLGTALAVPAFRARILSAAGLSSPPNSRAEVYKDVQFFDPQGRADAEQLPGLIRTKGPLAANLIVDATPQTYDAENDEQVQRVADHLAVARERKFQRVLLIGATMPDQAFLAAVRSVAPSPGFERLRAITWMETIDIALHLLDRRAADGNSGRFLLEQYVRFLKAETVREAQKSPGKTQGALFFNSLGNDWRSFASEMAERGEVDPKDPRLSAIASNWLALVRFMGLFVTRGAMQDEDIVVYPNVKAGSPHTRRDLVIRRLKAEGKLFATFKKREERTSTLLCADLMDRRIVFQAQVQRPSDKNDTSDHIADLANLISEGRTLGDTRIKIFWPGEKQARVITRAQALEESIATAPPQHGLLPEKFIVERSVPCAAVVAEPDTFVQLLSLELRGFRAATRHLLHRGLAA